jgi:hypothetical protein
MVPRGEPLGVGAIQNMIFVVALVGGLRVFLRCDTRPLLLRAIVPHRRMCHPTLSQYLNTPHMKLHRAQSGAGATLGVFEVLCAELLPHFKFTPLCRRSHNVECIDQFYSILPSYIIHSTMGWDGVTIWVNDGHWLRRHFHPPCHVFQGV